MGSGIAAATDALLSLAATAVTGLAYNGVPVTVVDGYAEAPTAPTLCIGLATPPDLSVGPEATVANRQWFALGAAETLEQFVVPGYVDCIAGGNETMQASTRAFVVSVLDALWEALRGDLISPASTLAPVCSGLVRISDIILTPYQAAQDAQQARRTVGSFRVTCINEYTT